MSQERFAALHYTHHSLPLTQSLIKLFLSQSLILTAQTKTEPRIPTYTTTNASRNLRIYTRRLSCADAPVS